MNKFVLFCASLLLISCSFRSPKSQFYVMNSNNLSSLSSKNMTISVRQVKVPDILDKSQMVIYDKDTPEVKILEYHRWADVLPDIIQTTVTNDLMAYLPNSYVKSAYFDYDLAPYSVSIEINRIEAHQGGDVILSAWWNIMDKKGKIIKREQSTYTSHTSGDSIQDLVEAQTIAVHQMSREIAENLLNL